MLPSLEAGMIPKIEACMQAVNGGVGRATIIDGRVAHSLLLEIFTTEGIGTMVVPEDEPDGNEQRVRPSAAALEAEEAQ